MQADALPQQPLFALSFAGTSLLEVETMKLVARFVARNGSAFLNGKTPFLFPTCTLSCVVRCARHFAIDTATCHIIQLFISFAHTFVRALTQDSVNVSAVTLRSRFCDRSRGSTQSFANCAHSTSSGVTRCDTE